jgi:hypothetical protein
MLLRNRQHAVIIGLAMAGLLIAGGLIWVFSMKAPQDTENAPSPISITSLHNDVLVRATGAEFETVNGQATTTSGSTVKTSPTGRALISSANSHTTLVDYSSEIVLSQDANTHTSIGLLTGAVWSRLEKTFDSGEYYEIKTGNTVAAVRGTSFGMWYAGGTTTLIVIDGSVLFSAIDLTTGLVIPGTEVVVTAGHKAVRVGTGEIVVSEVTDDERHLPWVVFNTEEAPSLVPQPAPRASDAAAESSTPVGNTVPSTVPSTPASPAPPAPAQPELSSLSPSTIPAGSTRVLTLKGTGLQDVRIVQAGTVRVPFSIVSSTMITFTATDVPAGIYSIKVTALDNRTDILSQALTITPPPSDQPRTYDPNAPQ